jgi:hypothetical protein
MLPYPMSSSIGVHMSPIEGHDVDSRSVSAASGAACLLVGPMHDAVGVLSIVLTVM